LGRATRPTIRLSLPFDVVFAINHLSSSIVRDAIHQPSRLPCCRAACVLVKLDSLSCVALRCVALRCVALRCVAFVAHPFRPFGISSSSLNPRCLHSHHPFSHTRLCSLRAGDESAHDIVMDLRGWAASATAVVSSCFVCHTLSME
jgi:hypothetical protein